MPLLSVEQLTKRFVASGPPVVDAVSFEVHPGEFFALLGPSGCGKTTTLRLIAGFERPDAGRISCDGQLVCATDAHLPPEQRGIGFVFQDYALFPHLCVLDNVQFGLSGRPRNERTKRAQSMLERVGLAEFADRFPHQLSGGQQQRVALARALAPSPRLLLLDEPFSNLDALLRQTTRHDVRTLLRDEGVSALLVTHDQEEAFTLADRVAVMNAGRIEQIATPEELYARPQSRFVANFLGPTNLMPAHAEGDTAQSPLGKIQLDRPAHGPVLLALRPEHLALLPPENGSGQNVQAGCDGLVTSCHFKGRDLAYRIAHAGNEYLVYAPSQTPYRHGDDVVLCPCRAASVVEEL
ncbi:MAG: ABC transporter ATP-binding protein [Bacteroidota bacterium]